MWYIMSNEIMTSWFNDAIQTNLLICVVLKGTDEENEYIASQGNIFIKLLTANETPLLQNEIPLNNKIWFYQLSAKEWDVI